MVTIDPEKSASLSALAQDHHKITAETGVKIDIEQDGGCHRGSDMESGREGQGDSREPDQDVEVGKTYTGKVTRLAILRRVRRDTPGKEGLVRTVGTRRRRAPRRRGFPVIGDEIIVQGHRDRPYGQVEPVKDPGVGTPARASQGETPCGGGGGRRPGSWATTATGRQSGRY